MESLNDENEAGLLDFGDVELVIVRLTNELIDCASAMVANQLVANLFA